MYHQQLLLLVIGISASFFVSASIASPAQQNAEQVLSYNNGVLSGSARNQSIKTALKSLGKAVKLDIEQRYRPNEKDTISYQFSGLDLQTGLKELLRDYSYLLIPSSDTTENNGKLILLNKKTRASTEPAYAHIIATPVNISEPPPNKEAGEIMEKKPFGPRPRGLNEFKSLPNLDPNVLYEEQTAGNENEKQAKQQLEEKRLQRALDALETDFDNLHQDALAELKDMSLPEATAALLEVASGTYGESVDLQYNAAKALWEHAANLQYDNVAANAALLKLQSIKVPGVDELALQALADMKYVTSQKLE